MLFARKASDGAGVGDNFPAPMLEVTLRRLLQSASSYPDQFEGAEEKITFEAESPPWSDAAGPYRYSLRLTPTRNERELVADWRDAARSQVAGQSVLARGVSKVSLSYYSEDKGWRKTWRAADRTPSLVRFQASGAHQTSPETVDLYIALPARSRPSQ